MIPSSLESQINQQVADTREQVLRSAGNPPEKVETVASVCAKVSQITDEVMDELAALRSEKDEMLTAIKEAHSSFKHIDDHPSDFTSPEIFYWNARNQARSALTKLQPFLP